MSKDLINYYLQSLNIENAIYLSSKYGIHFTYENAAIILPIIKKNWIFYTQADKKQCFLKDIASMTNNIEAEKVDILLGIIINSLQGII